MDIPDIMPVLSAGGHIGPWEGGCFMEIAAWLAGEHWTDRPRCADFALTGICQSINDICNDEQRQEIADLIPRVIGTNVGLIVEHVEMTAQMTRTAYMEAVHPAYGFLARWADRTGVLPDGRTWYGLHHEFYEIVPKIIDAGLHRQFLVDLFDWWDEQYPREQVEVTTEQWAQAKELVR